MKTLIIALGFLTRLPMPRVEADEVDFARAIRLYPVAGLVVGVIVAGAGWLGAHVDPWTGALAALIAWVWATGRCISTGWRTCPMDWARRMAIGRGCWR